MKMSLIIFLINISLIINYDMKLHMLNLSVFFKCITY